MVNKDDFAKRLEELLAYYDITAATLANKLGIQRSSISHLLSARNKPSLDFVVKVLDNYPDVSFDWFVRGIGAISIEPNSNELKDNTPSLFDTPSLRKKNQTIKDKPSVFTDVNTEESIEKIVLFYSDGSFKSYSP